MWLLLSKYLNQVLQKIKPHSVLKVPYFNTSLTSSTDMENLEIFQVEFGAPGSKKKAQKNKASRRGSSCSVDELQILASQHPTGYQGRSCIQKYLILNHTESFKTNLQQGSQGTNICYTQNSCKGLSLGKKPQLKSTQLRVQTQLKKETFSTSVCDHMEAMKKSAGLSGDFSNTQVLESKQHE